MASRTPFRRSSLKRFILKTPQGPFEFTSEQLISDELLGEFGGDYDQREAFVASLSTDELREHLIIGLSMSIVSYVDRSLTRVKEDGFVWRALTDIRDKAETFRDVALYFSDEAAESVRKELRKRRATDAAARGKASGRSRKSLEQERKDLCRKLARRMKHQDPWAKLGIIAENILDAWESTDLEYELSERARSKPPPSLHTIRRYIKKL
jgi:hypothetical protein